MCAVKLVVVTPKDIAQGAFLSNLPRGRLVLRSLILFLDSLVSLQSNVFVFFRPCEFQGGTF